MRRAALSSASNCIQKLLVPDNIRHDLYEMKSLGTDVVCIGITENITNRDTKVLPQYGERYLKAGRKNGLKTMMLVENQELTKAEVNLMDKTFPQILEMDVDFLIYYYYGFYDEDPEYKMEVIRKYVPQFKITVR